MLMLHRLALPCAAAILFLGAAARPILPPQPKAPSSATMEDLRGLYTKANYRTCLQEIAQLLLLGKNAPPGFERSDLYYLRGDCLLAQNDYTSALFAYESAAKEATTPAQRLPARAMVILLRGSSGTTFRITPGAPAIDIKSADGRKAALSALFTQRLPAVRQQVASAATARSLPPIASVLPSVLDIAALEYSTTGGIAQSLETASKLGDRARDLIGTELSRINGDLNALQARANAVITNNAIQYSTPEGRVWWEGIERQGLSSDDRNRLRKDAAYLEQILDACDQGTEIAQAYGGNVEAWRSLTSDCQKAGALINQISARE